MAERYASFRSQRRGAVTARAISSAMRRPLESRSSMLTTAAGSGMIRNAVKRADAPTSPPTASAIRTPASQGGSQVPSMRSPRGVHVRASRLYAN